MRYCETHWQALRDGVELRGMTHLVAADGEQAAENMVAELEGEERFDPLMGSHWIIARRVLKNIASSSAGASAALSFFGDPEWCPLCTVQQSYDLYGDRPRPPEALDAQGWIDMSLDGALEYARREGLMPKVS